MNHDASEDFRRVQNHFLIDWRLWKYPGFEVSCFGNSKLTQKRFKDLINISKMNDIKYESLKEVKEGNWVILQS